MNLLCIKPYSSSLFYGLIVFSAHTGNNWDLDLRQLLSIINTLIVKKNGRTTPLNLTVPHATHSVPLRCFSHLKGNPFFSDFNFRFLIPENILLQIVWGFTTCHFLKRENVNAFVFFLPLLFFDKTKYFQGVEVRLIPSRCYGILKHVNVFKKNKQKKKEVHGVSGAKNKSML